MGEPYLILASNSPRRRDLLELCGWMFNTRPVDIDESRRRGEAPDAYVLRLAESKAHTCAASTHDDLTILAADTAVVDGRTILGKPKNKAEAVKMLRRLRNRTHQVYTGIAVLSAGNLGRDHCVTNVPMRAYSMEEIETYVATGDPLDKAGAYAIQDREFHPVEMMSGCYASVMGLPLCHLTRTLRQIGIIPRTDISAGCLSSLNYTCPISGAVLRGEQVG